MRIQLAIQGGGAKLITLLAAARALQEMKGVEVTRIIGTSAGAMVGVLFAAGVDLEGFRSNLESGLGKRLSDSMFPPRGRHFLSSAMTGRPIWQTKVLKEVIETALADQSRRRGGIPLETLGDILRATRIDMRIVAANLQNPTPEVFRPETDPKDPRRNVTDLLLQSAGIPLYFRTWRDGPIVDGGLVQNFPWEELQDSRTEDYGPILGISFKTSTREVPKTRKDYAKAILETAMDASTERARVRLGRDRVLSLPVAYDTFDFEHGMDQNAVRKHFADTKTLATAWFRSRFQSGGHVIRRDPWSEMSISAMEKLAKMYEEQHSASMLKYHSMTFEIIAHGLESEETPDVTRYSIYFSAINKDIYCHTVALSQSSEESGAFKQSIITLWDKTGEELKIEYLPVQDRKTPEKREILLFFEKVLPAGTGPYRLVVEDFVQGLTSDILTKKRDNLFVRAQRSAVPIDEVTVIMHVPGGYGGAHLTQSPDLPSGQVPGTLLGKAACAQFSRPAPNWVTHGWSGKSVLPKESFGPMIYI